MMEDVGFAAVAAVTLVAAAFVVLSKNLIRAVLWLALCLLGTAVLYAMLDAPFLAGVQVLTYIGGVVTLLVFGVMVTRRVGGVIGADSAEPGRALIAAGALFAGLALAANRTELVTISAPPAPSMVELGRSLLTEQLVAFEAVSLLLLAAAVGAVVLARRRDPVPGEARVPGVVAVPRVAALAEEARP
jgi:NADH-quinone oxidoreductase subunit J